MVIGFIPMFIFIAKIEREADMEEWKKQRALDFLLEKSSFDLDEVNKYFNTVVRTVNKSKDPSKKVMVNVTRLDELKQQRKQVFASNIAKNEKNIQEREKSKLEEYKNKFIKLSEERNKKAKEEQKLKEEKEKARIAKEKAEQEEKLKKEQE